VTASSETALPDAVVAEPPARRRPRSSRFFAAIVAITALAHLPVVAGVARFASRAGLPMPWLFGVGWGALGVGLLRGRLLTFMPDMKRGRLGAALVDLPYFVHWCACAFTLVPAIAATIIGPIVSFALGRGFALPLDFYGWTYAAGLVVASYGVVIRRRWAVVHDVDVAIHGLDPRFDGYRIAQLSDLHIGSHSPRAWGERWVAMANARNPDLVVVTGDLVTSGTDFHQDIAAVIGQLRGKDGVFVSMGNHDYFGEGDPLIALLRASGARVLRNEGVLLERGGASVYLAAIDDTWTKRDDMDLALEARPPSTPVILLAHDPARFADAIERGVDLVLSGHTHGGQIAVPFLAPWLSLAHITHEFVVGLYERGKSTLYVHPGLGTTGPPVRLGVAPAVAIITLHAA
jgi:predicted MPP superfamily phosphohydrolase